MTLSNLVFVRPLRATLWVAQLTEPVIEISPGCFNVDRPTCRYFVRTEALPTPSIGGRRAGRACVSPTRRLPWCGLQRVTVFTSHLRRRTG